MEPNLYFTQVMYQKKIRSILWHLWPLIIQFYIIYNSGKDSFFKNFDFDLFIHVQNSGRVTAESRDILFETWCSDVNEVETNWPNDEVECKILLGAQGYYSLIPAEKDFFQVCISTLYAICIGKKSLTVFKIAQIRSNEDEAEWLLYGHMISYNVSIDSVLLPTNSFEQSSNNNLAYFIRLKRNTQFYNMIFSNPLIGW